MIGATLCSGIGAPECAAPWIDWRWHAEIEAFPAAVHAVRFPGSVNLGDMSAPDLVERAAAIALPDVIVAGTPCQAFSLAGSRGSLSDARGNLTLQFVRICNAIDDLRRAAGLAPLWVLWENVPGVFSTGDNAFGSFLGGMVGADAALEPPRGRGWTHAGVVSGPARCAAWRVLDAQYIGLAQRRERVFVLARGGAGTWAAADALLPIVEGVHWHPAPSREAGKRVARPIASSSPGGSGYRNDADTADNLIAGTLRHTDGGSGVDHARAGHMIVGAMTANGGTSRKHGQGWGQREWEAGYTVPVPLGLGEDGQLARALNACHTASGRHDVSVDTFVAHTLRGDGFDASEDGSGRGTPLVPVSVALRGRDEGATAEMGDDKAFALRASSGGGDKPHVLAHAFDARQSDVIQYGDRAGPLDTDRHSQAVALSSKDHGADAGEIAPTMRAMGHSGSHGNAGGQLAIAYDPNKAGVANADATQAGPAKALRELRDATDEEAFAEWCSGIVAAFWPEEVLRANLHGFRFRRAAQPQHGLVNVSLSREKTGSGWSVLCLWQAGCDGRPPCRWEPSEQLAAELGAYLSQLPHAPAPTERFLRDLRDAREGARALQQALSAVEGARRSAAQGGPPTDSGSAVRRLTAMECEALQGFPRGYTAIEYRGKPAADGPRYKALGNSMAVPVMRYLLQRVTDTDAADA